MARFEVGRTYTTSYAGDHTLLIHCTIISRTEKSVTFRDDEGRTKRCKLYQYNGSEFFRPYGSYSMAPCISAA